jgi:hypothetical protein
MASMEIWASLATRAQTIMAAVAVAVVAARAASKGAAVTKEI